MPLARRSLLTFALGLCSAGSIGAQTVLHEFDGDGQGDRLGTSVAVAGDVDGDRVPDIIAGSIFDLNHGTGAGMARVYSGATGATLFTFHGTSNLDFFGHAVDGAGDVNGDGYDDLVVGAPYADPNGSSSGSATVFSGFDGSVLHTLEGEAGNDQFGYAVSAAGDLDGDGFDDVLVGAWLHDSGTADTGRAQVFSGRDGTLLLELDGASTGDNFGRSVGLVGDIDGDLVPDYVIGAYRADANGTDSGSAYVFSGATGAVLWTFHGASADDHFGYSVAGAGDVDADGVADVIVGALDADGIATSGGMARVFSGATGAVLHTFQGVVALGQLGNAVGGAGDIDGDGHADLIVGSFGESTTGPDAGAVRVFSGADGSVLFLQNGATGTERFGWAVDGGADIDGDVLPDLVIGVRGKDSNGNFDAGGCVVYDAGFVGDAGAWTIYGTACPGTGGRIPRIGHLGRPQVSSTIGFTLRGAPAFAAATLLYGNPQPVPVPLDIIGLIGCTLYNSPFVNQPAPCDANGRASITIPLSADPGQIGSVREMQWVVADPGAPYALPLSLSDGLELHIGG
ncbi:MAG: FG-GAP repeat protein [Planctomycetes bacterium]|nr:FG-GAP repeat protein [Planctomycetota bacterium]